MFEITTNNHRRETVDGWFLPDDIRKEFDYVDWTAIDEGRDSRSFVKYKGEWFDLNDVMRCEIPELLTKGWAGFNSDTHFSGHAFKWVYDEYGNESVIIGRVFASDDFPDA